MACFNVAPWEAVCVVCYEPVPTITNNPELGILPREQSSDNVPIQAYWISRGSRQRGWMVHHFCYETLATLLQGKIKANVIDSRLRLLAESMAFESPVSEAYCLVRAKDMAGKALNNALISMSVAENSSTGLIEQLKRLPEEIRISIGQLSCPNELTRLCTIRQVAAMLCTWPNEVQPLQRTYLTEVDLNTGKDLVLTRDNIGCLSVNSRWRGDARRWCRLLNADHLRNAQVLYKGIFVKDVLCHDNFQSSYLWDTVKPPLLSPEHSHRLPATDLTFQSAIERPIRMRYLAFPSNTRAISAACAYSTTLTLHAHADSGLGQDFYRREEDLADARDLTWLHFPLDEDETIVEAGLVEESSDGTDLHNRFLVLFTSAGRPLYLGPYIAPDHRSKYKFKPLVKDATQEVAAICINERRFFESIRMSVVARPALRPLSSPPHFDPWRSDVPDDDDSESHRIAFWPCHRSRLDLSAFRSFRACTERRNGQDRCLGLRLSGGQRGGDRVLGQWRHDRTISDVVTLPSELVLVNAKDGHFPFVAITAKHAVESRGGGVIALEKILEWQTAPGGDRVAQSGHEK